MQAEAQQDPTEGGQNCDFCQWQSLTAEDTFGRWRSHLDGARPESCCQALLHSTKLDGVLLLDGVLCVTFFKHMGAVISATVLSDSHAVAASRLSNCWLPHRSLMFSYSPAPMLHPATTVVSGCPIHCRIERAHAVTASNLFKYCQPCHGLVLFKHHDPLSFHQQQLSDLLSCSQGWFQAAHRAHPEAVHPFFIVELWRSCRASSSMAMLK